MYCGESSDVFFFYCAAFFLGLCQRCTLYKNRRNTSGCLNRGAKLKYKLQRVIYCFRRIVFKILSSEIYIFIHTCRIIDVIRLRARCSSDLLSVAQNKFYSQKWIDDERYIFPRASLATYIFVRPSLFNVCQRSCVSQKRRFSTMRRREFC